MHRLLWIILACLLLSTCSVFQDTSDNSHIAMCKELKRRIIFNATTTNQSTATQERAYLERLHQNYRDQGC